MSEDHEVLRGEPNDAQRWDAYFLQVRGDLLHHIALLSALLAHPMDSVELSSEVHSEMVRVNRLIAIYSARSAEDLEDFRTGLGLPGARRAPAVMLQT